MKKFGQGQRLRAQCRDAAQRLGCQQRVDAAFQRSQGNDRRRAAHESRDTVGGPIVRREVERRRVAEPPGERLAEMQRIHRRGVSRVRPDERGRARPAVQVLVAATHGKIGGLVRVAAAVQVDRHGAGRMRQVPDDECAGGVRRAIDRGHLVHPAIAIVDVREHQHRNACVELRWNRVGVHAPQLDSTRAGDGLGDVEVGREIIPLGQNHVAFRPGRQRQVKRHAQDLEQVHRSRIGNHQFTRACADQPGDLVAHPLRQVDPAGSVPAADQAAAPLVLDDAPHARGDVPGQRAERVPVEVDDACGQCEEFTQARERIVAIQALAGLACRRHRCVIVGARRNVRAI